MAAILSRVRWVKSQMGQRPDLGHTRETTGSAMTSELCGVHYAYFGLCWSCYCETRLSLKHVRVCMCLVPGVQIVWEESENIYLHRGRVLRELKG